MKNPNITKLYLTLCMSIITHIVVLGQFVPATPVIQPPGTPLWTINAQVRPRGEIRHGLANPVPADAPAAAFVSQRTNLNLGFRWDKLNFNVDIRDVRVWGQDASSINNNDGSKLFLHQAWGEFTLATTADTNCKLKIDNLSLKVGRQEIGYDDARLLGNLDWLQQGRRHDAAILKFMHKGYQADLGTAFNQNTDAFNTTGVQYVGVNGFTNPVSYASTANPWIGTAPSTNALSNNYKMFQYLYLARRFNQTRVSLLGFVDQFQKYDLSTATNTATGITTITRTYRANNDIKSRITVGGQFSTQIGNSSEGIKTAISGGAYGQFGFDPRRGETRNGANELSPERLNAYHIFGYATFSADKWSFGPGFDILSGNSTRVIEGATNASSSAIGTENNRFDPLYGTPHRWWGYMDFFYVGTGAPTSGLANYYLKGKYTENKWFASADLHQFFTASHRDVMYRKVGGTEDVNLGNSYGQELDLILNYQANKFTNIEFGYSCMISTDALAASKNFKVGNTGYWNHWGYLQINIRPDFLFQKPVAIKN